MKIRILGLAEEVGRSSFLIVGEDASVLLDYGVELTRPPKFPLHISPKELDAIYLSHSHLDHVGAAPFLYTSMGIPLFTTSPTIDLAGLLIRDFLKLSGEYLPYEYIDYIYMKDNTNIIFYREPITLPNKTLQLEIFDAGHIPGSAQIIVDDGKTRLMYTGDINTYETRLQKSADKNYDDIDILIIESTYADEIHPDRNKMERAFVDKIREVVDDGGIALIPAFALGRSQEMLLILHHQGYKGRLFIDGMAVTATEILLKHKNFLKSHKSLKKAFKKAKKIRKWRERKKAVKEPGVIIAPAGMLGGGSAVFYMNKVYENEKNGIFLVGYQAPGTPGKTLLEEKIMNRGGVRKKVKSQVYYFQFSSHTDQKGLEDIIRKLTPDTKIMVVHGEETSRVALKKLCEEKYGMNVILPNMGDEFVFD